MSAVSTVPETKVTPLNIRIRQEQRSLIERAAAALDKTVSDFVRDAALREATNALLDKTVFHLNADAWAKFNAALDTPPASNPRLQDLMSRQPVWAK
ncbi:MAG: DUF1778 domain-containing protein [Gammaproteobacteria bacterium]|nr:DUF1778 domain-containing protein [Gammaproteobacteria bacterium]MBU1725566.1 DUF1778 domain-containing protein [Gammaproteobacteria bacterium]MBU2004299.1 DUF1778 domain-containing protein [Gammaproteobacteria bacterium]